jgi:hypothetical protein
VSNGHGGARPGAGRKKKTTQEEQETRRSIFLEVFDPEATRASAAALLARIKADGDPVAFGKVAPYILGRPPEEIKADVKVTGGVTIYLPDRKQD